MNKILLSVLISVITLINAFSQSWIPQNAGLQSATDGVNKISIVDENVTWCLSNMFASVKEFSRTTNGGNTWSSGVISPAPSNSYLTGIAAIDSLTAFICIVVPNAGGSIYKTNDGGSTWNQSGAGTVFTDSLSYPNEIYFWDAANGFVFGDPIGGVNEIYLTTDSGNTWTQVSSTNIPTNTNGTVTAYSPLVVMDSTIWFPSFSGHLFKSTDKGQTWTKTIIDTAVDMYGLSFLDDKLHGIAVAGNFNLYQTSDGGNTWNQVTPTGMGPWYIIRNIPNTNFFVSVSHVTGYSSYSYDYGNSWTIIDSLTPYYGLAFKDINIGYAGGIPQSPAVGGIYKWNPGMLLSGIPETEAIRQLSVYPNPASSFVKFSFYLNETKSISGKIYDLTGREIKTLLNEKLNSGDHTYTWNITDENNMQVKNGLYFIKFDAADFTLSRTFTVIK